MDGIPGDLYKRVQAALLRCGPFDSDRTLRPLFVDARLSAWRDLLPEASNRVERAQAVIEALSERTNPAGENALALLLRVIAENTPPGDACRGQLATLAGQVAAVLRGDMPAGGGTPPAQQPPAGSTLVDQHGQHVVGTQINVAGNYYEKGADTASPVAASPGDIPSLRARLQRLDAVGIESLCLDYFPAVYDKFARGLQRGEMINLLLDHCRRNPDAAARLEALL